MVSLNSHNHDAMVNILMNSGATRFGLMEGVGIGINNLYIAVIRSISEGFPNVLEVFIKIFTDSMIWLLDQNVWEAITSGDLFMEFSCYAPKMVYVLKCQIINY